MFMYDGWYTPVDPTYMLLAIIILVLLAIDAALFAVWLVKRSGR